MLTRRNLVRSATASVPVAVPEEHCRQRPREPKLDRDLRPGARLVARRMVLEVGRPSPPRKGPFRLHAHLYPHGRDGAPPE